MAPNSNAIEGSPQERTRQIVHFLAQPAAYPHTVDRVELVETHISHVFLAGRYAYKLKKPVRFEFLDFGTLAKRAVACQDEVKLNRRLARSVYVGLVPITMTAAGRFQLGGVGEPVEWLVQMHRLSPDQALDARIRQGGPSEAELRELATCLATFYTGLPPVSMRTDRYRDVLATHIQGNYRTLLLASPQLDPALVTRIHEDQLRWLGLAEEWLDARVLDGRIVEGHGDLRPEHIYFTPPPQIIDCVEFSEEFRTLDVLDELAFLAMECDQLGAARVGQQVLRFYQRACEDWPPAPLLPLYMGYRACVRAKVCWLQYRQHPDEVEGQRLLAQARRYLQLADTYRRQLAPPAVIVIRGLTGSGKSTLAEALGERLRMEVLKTDLVRQELRADGPASSARRNVVAEPVNAGRYTAERRADVYRVLLEHAAERLADEQSVILDGTFIAAEWRRRAAELANQMGASFLQVRCDCPPEVAKSRIEHRARQGGSESESYPEVYDRQRQEEEEEGPDRLPCWAADTSRHWESLLIEFLPKIRDELAAAPSPAKDHSDSPNGAKATSRRPSDGDGRPGE